MAPCQATTKSGKPCKSKTMQNSKYCSVHIGYEEETNNDDDIMEETMTENVKAPTNSRSTSLAGTYSNSQSYGSSSESHSSLMERFEKIEKTLHSLVAKQEKSKGKKVKTEKKARKMNAKGALRSAAFIFYNEHKKDANIIESVRQGLINGNMLVMKTVMVDGVEVQKPQIPWMLIKTATDIKFNALNDDEKEVYVKKAYEKNASE